MGTKKTRNDTKHKGLKPFSIPSIAWVLVLVSIIAAISINRNYEINQQPAPTTATNVNTQWKKITSPNVMFFSKIFLQRNKTYIGIPFKYDSEIQTTWLSLSSTSSATPTQWLVTHPVLKDLSWNSINEDTVYLYQKKKQYNSIDDFLKSPPPQEKLVIDDSVINVAKFKNIKGTLITDKFNLNDFDFILTTYKTANQKGNEFFYTNIVDATYGAIDKYDQLTWTLRVPTASESASFSIGEIHIDYR